MVVYADRNPQGHWVLYCEICKEDIGVVTTGIMMDALRFGQENGGIRCPDCRKRSCIICHVVAGELSTDKLCVKCHYDNVFANIMSADEAFRILSDNGRD